MKSFFSKSLIFTTLFAFFSFSIAAAEVKQVNLLDRNGNIVEQHNFNLLGSESDKANERMRFFWYCWSKKMFSGLSCDYADRIINKSVAQNIFSQQAPVPKVGPVVASQNPQTVSDSKVIYQVIERAAPGPQGPAGRDGVTTVVYQNDFNPNQILNNNINLANYSTSPTYSAQYNGFGIQSTSAVNPTGDAVLSTISGSGLLSCNATSSKLVYNSTTKMFECGTDQGGSGLTSMPENATFTLATVTSATSTNLFASILSATTNYLTNLLFTNATGTNATTTNFATTNFQTSGFSIIPSIYGTNATFTNATVTNLSNTNISTTNIFTSALVGTNSTITNSTTTNIYSQNATFTSLNAQQATFSYATVTNGFFTNLSVTGPVSAALTNGYIFRGGTNNFSEATSTIFLSDNGKVGVGSTTPSERLSIQGNVLVSGNIVNPKISGFGTASNGNDIMLCVDNVTGQINYDINGDCWSHMTNSYSDVRLKKNIATITSALEKVKGLSTVNFNWIDETRGTTTQLGYIAQDVEKVLPEVIVHDDAGYLKVNYISLSAIYANAIKELDKLVSENISAILDRLTKNEEEILNLKTRVSNLENTLNISAPVVPVEPEILPQEPVVVPEGVVPEGETPVSVPQGDPVLPVSESAI